MSARVSILDRIRANKPKGEYPLPILPRFGFKGDEDLIALFVRNLSGMGGRGLRESSIESLLRDLQAKIVASAVSEYEGNLNLACISQPDEVANADVAIVRAHLGVAETGSVLLTNDALVVNAVGYLSQHLIVLLDSRNIVPTLQEAYDHPDFRLSRYACFNSGPSATADIEGVLIHGAQGVRSLTVLIK